MLRKVTIVGVGLIGGSIGLELRKGAAERVVGVGRRRGSVEEALRCGAIDEGTVDLEAGCRDSELVIIATPPEKVVEIARKAVCIAPEASITDVASTKSAICSGLEEVSNFVGSHPLAGSHHRGVRYAKDGLFKGCLVICCPSASSSSEAVERALTLWVSLGARVITMSAEEHDRIMALVSHLPHGISACLVASAGEEGLEYGASGYRDATRVAESDPELWTQIFLCNRVRLLSALEAFRRSLDELYSALESGDRESIFKFLSHARELRSRYRNKS